MLLFTFLYSMCNFTRNAWTSLYIKPKHVAVQHALNRPAQSFLWCRQGRQYRCVNLHCIVTFITINCSSLRHIPKNTARVLCAVHSHRPCSVVTCLETYEHRVTWPGGINTGQSLIFLRQKASNRRGLGSIPGQAMSDFLYWNSIFSKYFAFPLSLSFHNCSIFIHPSICHRRCVILATDS